MLTNSQRRELRNLVVHEYLDLPAACSAAGIRIQSIPPDLMAELVEAYNSVTSLIEGNLLRQVLAADDPADTRWLAQQVERRRQAQVRMPQADGQASVSQLLSKLSDTTLQAFEALLRGDEDPLAHLIEARVKALVDQGVVAERVKRQLERPFAAHPDASTCPTYPPSIPIQRRPARQRRPDPDQVSPLASFPPSRLKPCQPEHSRSNE